LAAAQETTVRKEYKKKYLSIQEHMMHKARKDKTRQSKTGRGEVELPFKSCVEHHNILEGRVDTDSEVRFDRVYTVT
jgi:hypothetical protein